MVSLRGFDAVVAESLTIGGSLVTLVTLLGGVVGLGTVASTGSVTLLSVHEGILANFPVGGSTIMDVGEQQ